MVNIFYKYLSKHIKKIIHALLAHKPQKTETLFYLKLSSIKVKIKTLPQDEFLKFQKEKALKRWMEAWSHHPFISHWKLEGFLFNREIKLYCIDKFSVLRLWHILISGSLWLTNIKVQIKNKVALCDMCGLQTKFRVNYH